MSPQWHSICRAFGGPWGSTPALKEGPVQRPFHREVQALPRVAQQQAQKNTGASEVTEDGIWLWGLIARWEKPSFLTHSDDGAGEMGTVPGQEGSEGTCGGACVSLARFQGHNNSE